MTSSACCGRGGCDKFAHWIVPESLVAERLGNAYAQFPLLSRVVAVSIATLTGLIKPVLFPLMCLVGVIAMPILAAVRPHERKEWLKAWVFCLLGAAGSFAFFVLAGFQFPLVVTAGIFVGCVALSIVVHVYKLVKEPPTPVETL